MKLYRENEAALLADLRDGGFFLADRVPAEVLSAVRTRLRRTYPRELPLSENSSQ